MVTQRHRQHNAVRQNEGCTCYIEKQMLSVRPFTKRRYEGTQQLAVVNCYLSEGKNKKEVKVGGRETVEALLSTQQSASYPAIVSEAGQRGTSQPVQAIAPVVLVRRSPI